MITAQIGTPLQVDLRAFKGSAGQSVTVSAYLGLAASNIAGFVQDVSGPNRPRMHSCDPTGWF